MKSLDDCDVASVGEGEERRLQSVSAKVAVVVQPL